MFFTRILAICTVIILVVGNVHYFKKNWGPYDKKYAIFRESERQEMLEEARKMFTFGYDNYMRHAFPQDELDPIHCRGRGPDHDNPSNININDVLGDYVLTLVDALDTLAVMGNSSEFQRAVQLVIENVSFDKSNTVQVFEATIRVLGALLSAHLIIIDSEQPFGPMRPAEYDGELLHLAHDLASRLLPAFDKTVTGIPYPRVNLRTGVPEDTTNETCTSGAGSVVLEFSLLSRLLGDPVYESVARRSIKQLWKYRSNVTGLFGDVINIQTGEWVSRMSGLGAGLDSFFEYMLKAFILYGEKDDFKMFSEAYETIKFYLRKGRRQCNNGAGFPPIYVNVNMKSGEVANNWIDSLMAVWPGIQMSLVYMTYSPPIITGMHKFDFSKKQSLLVCNTVLAGDLEDAICIHALYYAIWQRYGALPERYNWYIKAPDVLFYPLRPELVESTYHLYQATKNPFYLHVGRDILLSLNTYTKVKCGYATIHDVNKKDLEDRMESFFLSETCKYLYLLFDTSNHLNMNSGKFLFTTEGHVLPVNKMLRDKPWEDIVGKPEKSSSIQQDHPVVDARSSNHTENCDKIPVEKQYFLPIEGRYMQQMESLVGLETLQPGIS